MTRLRRSSGAVALMLAVASAVLLAAQEPKGFEAATIKVNKSGGTQIRLEMLPKSGRINAVNVPMRTLMAAAFRVRGEQLIDLPAWVDRTRVDLIAKVDPSLTTSQIQDLLVPLLEDLARLEYHRGMRDFDVYALTLAAAGETGPNLKQAPTACGGPADVALNQTQATSNQRADGTSACGPVPSLGGPGHIVVHGYTMETWANWMTGLRMADRPVIDATGLEGAWDIDVKYTPDALSTAALAARGANLPPGLAALASQVDPDGPTLRQALQDQLGLKLEPKRMPREAIVIDRLEIPQE
jgi:uncharacterized protein (TIGR03435 family)